MMSFIDYTMKLITLNGKILRKDPKYYMQDVFEFPDYDGSYEKLEEFILNLDEDYEIHIINTGCMAKALLNLFKSMDEKSDKLMVFFDD